jgi:hypothetical protein
MFILQSRNVVMYRAFAIWRSKTRVCLWWAYISPIVDRDVSSLSLLFTFTRRMSGPGSGMSGETPCLLLYKPSKLARWIKRQSSVSRQPRAKPLFPTLIVILTVHSFEKWLQVYRTKVALRAVA